MAVIQDAFARKSVEFRDVLKMGRTQLQDAVPMTLGQEFSAFAVMLDEDRGRPAEAVELIHETPSDRAGPRRSPVAGRVRLSPVSPG